MSKWRCPICGYMLEAEVPPKICPMCKNKCSFVDDSCYTPECGLIPPEDKK